VAEQTRIERDWTQVVAEVDFADGYDVELRQARKRVTYTPDEAIILAAALVHVAEQAKADLQHDQAVAAQGAPTPVSFVFDLAPVCRECQEGKHAACTGIALVDNPSSVDELPCGCSRADHQVLGGAA
jgi:hypothetical protein